MDEPTRIDGAVRRIGAAELTRRAFLRRTGGGILAASSAATLASAVAPRVVGAQSPAAPAIVPGGTLRAALTGEPDTLDPATSTIYTGAQVYDNIFSKLIDIDENNQVHGVLATSWEQTSPTTWVFDLQEGVTFHNGEPFTSADVVYTFQRILDPATASGYTPLFDVIESIEATSPTQVTFTLKSPFGPFLTNIANNGQIVNQKAIESADPARNPVGTGPFRFVEWVQGDHVTLEKNPDYFKPGLPYLDGVVFRFLPVDQSRIESLRAGELDWVDAVPLQQLSSLASDPAFRYVTSPTAGIPDFLALNTTKPPFDDPNIRAAIALAVDRTQIRDIAYFGAGEVGSMEVPSGSPWFGGADPYAGGPDIEAAKAKLAEAGITGPITINYLGLPQYPELLKTGEVVREQLKAIGIDMVIEPVDVGVWFTRFVEGDYEITSAYQERTLDPDNFYALVLRSGGSINTTGYSDPDFDGLVEQARTETDEATRKGLYEQIRAKVWEDNPLVFAHYETINYLMNANVAGSTVNPTLELRLENVGFTG